MSKEPRDPAEVLGEETKTGRRSVIKRLVAVGLGAAALMQPNGGVFGTAYGQDKKEGEDEDGKKKKKGKKKGGDEEPKKD